MRIRLLYLCLVFLMTLFLLVVHSGMAQTPWFSYSGQASISGDFYRMNATGGVVRPRRPDELFRFMAAGSIGIKGVNIPFYIALMQGGLQGNIATPIPTNQNIFQFIINPINSVGFSPTFKFGKITLGTSIPRFSSYTSGDIRVFGVGLDAFFANKWRLAFHTGISQLAVNQDIIANVFGAYERRVLTGKVGYGNDNASHIHLAFLKTADASNAFSAPLNRIAPSDNMVIALNYLLKLGANYAIEGEFAQSGFTENTLMGEILSQNTFIQRFIPTNASTRLGNAAKISLIQTGKMLSTKLYADYMTEGFRTLGYPFLQSDQINYRIESRLSLQQGKIGIGGSLGERINNVSGLKAAKTSQLTVMLNANWQINDKLTITGSYNNFGMRNTARNDTLRIENITNSFNITPSYVLPTNRYIHVWNFSFSRDIFDDFNLFTGKQNSNNSTTLLATYMLNFKSKPLTLDLTLMQFDNQLLVQEMRMRSATTGATYLFAEKKMQSSFKVTYMENSIDKQDPSKQVLLLLTYKYSLLKQLSLDTKGSINLFRFGKENPNVRFRETLISTALTYNLR